jgi:hypothetical protein
MAEKKVPGTVHIHVDDINSLKFKTLLTTVIGIGSRNSSPSTLQAAEFGHPQAVPESDQDHGRVAMAVAMALGRLDQAFDLELGQVLAIAAHVPVAEPAQCDCP